MLFVCIMLLFFAIDFCKCFLFSCFVFVYFIFLICIMHSAFNLFVFPNSMFTSLFFFFLWKGYELSGEIALKNNHYYYYCIYLSSLKQRMIDNGLASRTKIRKSVHVDCRHAHCWRAPCERPWSTMECSQPAAWTMNRSLLVASRVRRFQEDRPIPAPPYPELRTWMVVRSGVISVFPTHSGNAPESPDIRPTTWLCSACLPSTNSIPAPIQPTIAMSTTHIYQLWLTRPHSTRSSSASEDHP